MQEDYLVNIQTYVVISTEHTYNIICESKYGDDSNRIVVGSHLGMCKWLGVRQATSTN